MAFNKKTWEDNVSDLTAAELNRMEQGIYDNSLVVDSIKDKLNPTDTETYTTEEITEGQFENVLAVKNILLKGNTSQNGDPTPSSPKEIHIVTGYNTVDIDGTNIYDSSYRRTNGSFLVINGSATEQDGNFVLRATAADVRIWQTVNKDVAWNENAGKLYEFNEDSYKIFITNPIIKTNYIVYYDKNKVSLGFTLFNSNSFVAKKSDKVGAEYFSLKFGNADSVAGDVYEFQVKMFSKNNSFPINLPAENLFYSDNYIQGKAYIDGSISNQTNWGIYYLPCTKSNKFFIKNLLAYGGTQIVQCDKNKNYISTLVNRVKTATEYTVTATQNGYIGVSFVWGNGSLGSELNTIKITNYADDTTPIELCKIGNYQDYFYKSGSKWYLHKETFKIVLDGTENFNNTYTAFGLEGIKKSIVAGGGLCNYYLYNNRNSGMTNLPNNYFAIQTVSGGSTSSVYFQNTAFTTVTDFKTDLAQKYENGKPVTLYYPSGTATNTEITDTTLISQLNAIINSPLYEDTNITQTNSDFPIILDITAYKDNIEGIKAWIRK